MNLPVRLLLIEDDSERVRIFTSWLPPDIRLVHAGSAGRALGILQRDRDAFAGIMLDHDLQGQTITMEDSSLSGSDIVVRLITLVRPDIPVFIHSMNPALAPQMTKRLARAGFSVTRMPMAELTETQFIVWLEEVRECWEDRF